MLTLQQNSLDWALNQALNYGDTDVFPLPFEYEAIQHEWTLLRTYLSSQNTLDWIVRPHRILLSTKAKYGFRVITQLDPLDFLIFSALIYEIGADIESRRIPMTDNVIFSYRFAPDVDGRLFNASSSYRDFLNHTNQLLNDNPSITHVVVTDIADFYMRIYHHRLENSLRSASSRTSHINALMGLLSGWNGTETFGIPIGNAPSRLLAEIAISDIDDALLANGASFVRFNDDYRIFASSHSEAYRQLVFLAGMLYRNHGLTLQPQKTFILETAEFRRRFVTSLLDREIDSLDERFRDFLDTLGISDPYEEIDYDDLTPEQQDVIDALNLAELFNDELNENDPDFLVIKFVLRRLGQLGDDSLIDIVLDNINILHPVLPDIIRYFQNLRNLTAEEASRIGSRVLDLINSSIISDLDYHKLWSLSLFSSSTRWNNSDRFLTIYNSLSDNQSKRKLILAMGRAGQRHWFQSQWRNLFDFPHWARRALLVGASCMPADARRHWYRSVEPQLDVLEKAIVRWIRANPFTP